MDAINRNIWVPIFCCRRVPANKVQTANTDGSIRRLLNEWNMIEQDFHVIFWFDFISIFNCL